MLHLPLLSILFLASISASAEPVNYCTDPQINADWKQLIREHRGEDEYERLYYIRDSLCRQVASGTLSLEDAIRRFEAERAVQIKRLRQRLQRESAGTLSG